MTFREVQIQEVLDVQWGDTKTTKSSYVDDGYLAYSATGPDGFLPKFDYDCDGVVLSAIGANCGSTFFATNKWSCIKNTIRILTKSPDIDLKYFYFMTKSPNFWPLRGSAQPFISQTDIREMVIKIPDLEIQRKIGEIVYELELSIEKNGQITETLERIAQAIFKSWFVDFEPVKAKMAGEKPVGMDDATAALFPDSMEDSEAGQIPNGWTALTLGRIASISKSTISPQHHPEVEFKHYSIPDFDRQQYPSTTLGLKILSNKFLLTTSSVLLSKLNPETKRVWTVMRPESSSICSTEFIVLVPKNETFLPFVHALTRHPNFYGRFVSLATGSTGSRQRVRPEEILSIAVVAPSPALLEKFAEMVRPCLEQQSVLCEKIQNLIDIRDALLPRLISGELQIPEELLAS